MYVHGASLHYSKKSIAATAAPKVTAHTFESNFWSTHPSHGQPMWNLDYIHIRAIHHHLSTSDAAGDRASAGWGCPSPLEAAPQKSWIACKTSGLLA